MGDRSRIEWTDATWTPIRAINRENGRIGWHCEHVSDGCRNCYAERVNRRLGTGLDFKPGHRKYIDLALDEKALRQPTRWRRPRMVFVCSMTDLFAPFVPDEWIDRVCAVMALCPQHTFQVLTKRPARMRAYFDAAFDDTLDGLGARLCRAVHDLFGIDPGPCPDFPLRNVWLGTSCEDQETFDERVPHLLATPAAVRFVSLEPLIKPIRLGRWLGDLTAPGMPLDSLGVLDWVIVGGESGPGARVYDLAWPRSIIEECQAAGVPVFHKQVGSRPINTGEGCVPTRPPGVHDPRGGSPDEWPEDLRVREMPYGC